MASVSTKQILESINESCNYYEREYIVFIDDYDDCEDDEMQSWEGLEGDL